MFELTINDKVYQFKFGMGFLREVNSKYQKPIDGLPGAKENIGLQLLFTGVVQGGTEYLVDVLDAANKGQNPRVTRGLIDQYIDECEDIDKLFDEVIEGLKSANATKKIAMAIWDELEKQKAEAEAN